MLNNFYTKKSLHLAYSFFKKRLVHLNLQLLYQCNFKCTICDFWKDDYKNLPHLSLNRIETISEKLKPLGPIVVSMGGGEPLMHKDIVGITHTLAKNNFPVMICNGWFVTPELARELFKAGLHEISISLDYANAEKHDAQRGKPGAYDRALTALQTLFENRVHSHQRVHMITVVMDDNIDEIENLIKLSKSIGVTYLITFYSNYRGEKESRASRTDISRRLLELKKKYPEFVALSEFINRFSEAQLDGGVAPCYAGKNLFNIDCVGNVTRCIDQLDVVAGNILNDDLDYIRMKLIEQTKTNECSACWTSCRGNIETMLYGKKKLQTMKEYVSIIRKIPLASRKLI
jgi:MoaA/NifB/PqqE/SkfB family radical SAM enzyme